MNRTLHLPVSALRIDPKTSLCDASVQIGPQDSSGPRQKPQRCAERTGLHRGRGQKDGQGKSLEQRGPELCPSRAGGHVHCQASEEASKILLAMKNLLYGTGEQEPQTEMAALLAQEIYNHHLLLQMVTSLPKIEFEVGRRFWYGGYVFQWYTNAHADTHTHTHTYTAPHALNTHMYTKHAHTHTHACTPPTG